MILPFLMNSLITSLFESYSKSKAIKVIDYMVQSSESLEAFWHPLGFIHIKLFKRGSENFRLHIWPQKQRSKTSTNYPIHNHIYDIESIVLSGRIGCQNYEVRQSKTSNSSLCDVLYFKDKSVLKSTKKKIKVIEKNLSWTNADNSYCINKGEFHQSVVPEGEFSATLLRNYNYSADSNPKVVVNSIKIDFSTQNIKVSDRVLKNNLNILKNRLLARS